MDKHTKVVNQLGRHISKVYNQFEPIRIPSKSEEDRIKHYDFRKSLNPKTDKKIWVQYCLDNGFDKDSELWKDYLAYKLKSEEDYI